MSLHRLVSAGMPKIHPHSVRTPTLMQNVDAARDVRLRDRGVIVAAERQETQTSEATVSGRQYSSCAPAVAAAR
jgi:hypothetical protein